MFKCSFSPGRAPRSPCPRRRGRGRAHASPPAGSRRARAAAAGDGAAGVRGGRGERVEAAGPGVVSRLFFVVSSAPCFVGGGGATRRARASPRASPPCRARRASFISETGAQGSGSCPSGRRLRAVQQVRAHGAGASAGPRRRRRRAPPPWRRRTRAPPRASAVHRRGRPRGKRRRRGVRDEALQRIGSGLVFSRAASSSPSSGRERVVPRSVAVKRRRRRLLRLPGALRKSRVAECDAAAQGSFCRLRDVVHLHLRLLRRQARGPCRLKTAAPPRRAHRPNRSNARQRSSAAPSFACATPIVVGVVFNRVPVLA